MLTRGQQLRQPGEAPPPKVKALASRARSEQNRLFCIIAGAPPGLCRVHSPVTPQLARPPGPGSGGLKACGWWAGARPAMALPAYKTVIFCSIRAKDQPGPHPLPRCGGGAAPPGGVPPIRPATPAGAADCCASKAPALAPAWPFGPPSAPPGAQRFRQLVGGPPSMVIGS